jgi:hypothetical protein
MALHLGEIRRKWDVHKIMNFLSSPNHSFERNSNSAVKLVVVGRFVVSL